MQLSRFAGIGIGSLATELEILNRGPVTGARIAPGASPNVGYQATLGGETFGHGFCPTHGRRQPASKCVAADIERQVWSPRMQNCREVGRQAPNGTNRMVVLPLEELEI